MHKLDEGFAQRYNKKEMDRMFKTYTDNTYKCRCGHSIAIAKNCEKVYMFIFKFYCYSFNEWL